MLKSAGLWDCVGAFCVGVVLAVGADAVGKCSFAYLDERLTLSEASGEVGWKERAHLWVEDHGDTFTIEVSTALGDAESEELTLRSSDRPEQP